MTGSAHASPRQPDWGLYRSFLAVLRTGSLSGAARELGLTQPTLGRHVDALEEALGFALFIRSQRGYLPTEAARELQARAESVEAAAAALLRAASSHAGTDTPGGSVRGTVRVTASEVIGAEVLPSILAGLRDAHPGLAVELVLSNRVDDLSQQAADIAVRMVRPAQGALVARRIGDIELGFHAHRDYVARHGVPASVEELRGHSLVGFDRETAFIRAFVARLRQPDLLDRSAFGLRADSDLAQLAAIRAGVGIGVCQVPLARRDPGLVRILPRALGMKLDTWLVMHEDLRHSPRCSVAFAAIATGLKRYVAGSSGRRQGHAAA